MSEEYESISDDILKPHIKEVQLKAAKIWDEICDKKIPVQLNDIIDKLGIHAKAENLNVDGYTRTDNMGVCCILYNSNCPVVRQRFTVAHEIGHIVLEHTSILDNCDQFSKKSQETEANLFANELLVPSEDLKKFVKNSNRKIEEITNRYWISKEVAFIAINKNRLLKKISK